MTTKVIKRSAVRDYEDEIAAAVALKVADFDKH